jgi:hypothetical protein
MLSELDEKRSVDAASMFISTQMLAVGGQKLVLLALFVPVCQQVVSPL